mgnify:CR=1 FL=1
MIRIKKTTTVLLSILIVSQVQANYDIWCGDGYYLPDLRACQPCTPGNSTLTFIHSFRLLLSRWSEDSDGYMPGRNLLRLWLVILLYLS